jgi:predicted phage terminase large subunit-like protein
MNNEVGGLVRLKSPQALVDIATPFVAGQVLTAMQYLDNTIEGKTGVSKASQGLDPDALQNTSATAARLQAQQGSAQIEVMARNLAEGGMKRLFKLMYTKILSKKVIKRLPSRKKFYNILIIGTILHHDSLLARLKEEVDFYKNFPLVLDFTTYKLDDSELDVNEIKKEYQEDKEAFLQEYQNIPLSEETLTFPHYKTYESAPKCDFYSIGIDPALGKTKGDYFAIASLGYKADEKRFYLTAFGYKKNPTDMIEKIIKTYIKYSKIARTIIAIETVAYQEFFKDVLKKVAKESEITLSIQEFKNNIPKELRINSLAPLIKDETILIDKKASLLIDELDTYPKSAHDDLLDASEMAKRAFQISAGVDYKLVRKHLKNFSFKGFKYDF